MYIINGPISPSLQKPLLADLSTTDEPAKLDSYIDDVYPTYKSFE